tara:strand:- start:106 stop:504 length:399 start_codon:yes stop_codon:yes gene_type:complete
MPKELEIMPKELEIMPEIENNSNSMQILMHANDKLKKFIDSMIGNEPPNDFNKLFNLKFKDQTTINSIQNKLQDVNQKQPINILNNTYLETLKTYLENENILTQYKDLLQHLITPAAAAAAAPPPPAAEGEG